MNKHKRELVHKDGELVIFKIKVNKAIPLPLEYDFMQEWDREYKFDVTSEFIRDATPIDEPYASHIYEIYDGMNMQLVFLLADGWLDDCHNDDPYFEENMWRCVSGAYMDYAKNRFPVWR